MNAEKKNVHTIFFVVSFVAFAFFSFPCINDRLFDQTLRHSPTDFLLRQILFFFLAQIQIRLVFVLLTVKGSVLVTGRMMKLITFEMK